MAIRWYSKVLWLPVSHSFLDSENKLVHEVYIQAPGTTKEMFIALLTSESKDSGDDGVENVFIQNQPGTEGLHVCDRNTRALFCVTSTKADWIPLDSWESRIKVYTAAASHPQPNDASKKFTALFFIVQFIFYFLAIPCNKWIEPMPPAVEAWGLNHWTAREVPINLFKKFLSTNDPISFLFFFFSVET